MGRYQPNPKFGLPFLGAFFGFTIGGALLETAGLASGNSAFVIGAAAGGGLGWLLYEYRGVFSGKWSLGGLFPESWVFWRKHGRDPFHGTDLPGATVAVVALAAKMAKADGHVGEREIRTFRRVVRVNPSLESDLLWVFNHARQSSTGFEPYARYLRDKVGDSSILEEVLDTLAKVAMAEGDLSPRERRFIEDVAGLFGLRRAGDRAKHRPGWASGRASGENRTGSEKDTPGTQWGGAESAYETLGIDSLASDRQVKKAYRDLARKHHPDYLHAQGLSEAMMEKAHDQMVRINAAYAEIKQARGMK